jgi:hypothetical protein
VILAQVALEHPDDDVQVRFDLVQMAVGLAELFVGPLL